MKICIVIIGFKSVNGLIETLERIPSDIDAKISEILILDPNPTDELVYLSEGYRHKKGIDKINTIKIAAKGYGTMQKKAISYSIEKGHDILCLLHGDGKYAPELLPEMINPIMNNKADLTLGNRFSKKVFTIPANRITKMPITRKLSNRVLTLFQNFLLRQSFSELHCGYRAYNLKMLALLPFEEASDDLNFDTELLFQHLEKDAAIAEVPVPPYYTRDITSINGSLYIVKATISTIQYKLHKLCIRFHDKYKVEEIDYSFTSDKNSSHFQTIKLIGSNKKVLSLGCGPGEISRKIKDNNNYIIGYDIIEYPEAKKNHDEFFTANIEEKDVFPEKLTNSFNICLLNDVIEHIKNPKLVLAQANKLLLPTGKYIISTGNVANIFIRLSLLFGRFEYGEKGILDKTHLHLYTRRSLTRLLNECGLKVEKLHYTPIPFSKIFNKHFRVFDSLYRTLLWFWPTLFAYQIIVEAKLHSNN